MDFFLAIVRLRVLIWPATFFAFRGVTRNGSSIGRGELHPSVTSVVLRRVAKRLPKPAILLRSERGLERPPSQMLLVDQRNGSGWCKVELHAAQSNAKRGAEAP